MTCSVSRTGRNLCPRHLVLPPTVADADYRVRIFTPVAEPPFAGHPRWAHAHACARTTKAPNGRAGMRCRPRARPAHPRGTRLLAPPLLRSGPWIEELVQRIAEVLGIERSDVVDSQWADNGPGWAAGPAPESPSSARAEPRVRRPRRIGVVGPDREGEEAAFQVRASLRTARWSRTPLLTGSLNASLAERLLRAVAQRPDVAGQGPPRALGTRRHSRDADGTIWVARRTSHRRDRRGGLSLRRQLGRKPE